MGTAADPSWQTICVQLQTMFMLFKRTSMLAWRDSIVDANPLISVSPAHVPLSFPIIKSGKKIVSVTNARF